MKIGRHVVELVLLKTRLVYRYAFVVAASIPASASSVVRGLLGRGAATKALRLMCALAETKPGQAASILELLPPKNAGACLEYLPPRVVLLPAGPTRTRRGDRFV
eukprot:4506677-Pyramimonas_sp.AAC.3